MTRKRSPSIVPRFTGSAGRRRLLDALCAQQAVGGDTALARRLLKVGTLSEHKTAKTIVVQGDADNTFYMIVSGSVSVIINKREIAVRNTGAHVGEMAMLDPTARRSATLVTRERTVLFGLPEAAVARVARTYPDFWRRLAVELSTRLRERTKYVREPNNVPIVFIGSSGEASAEAAYVQRAQEEMEHSASVGVYEMIIESGVPKVKP